MFIRQMHAITETKKDSPAKTFSKAWLQTNFPWPRLLWSLSLIFSVAWATLRDSWFQLFLVKVTCLSSHAGFSQSQGGNIESYKSTCTKRTARHVIGHWNHSESWEKCSLVLIWFGVFTCWKFNHVSLRCLEHCGLMSLTSLFGC